MGCLVSKGKFRINNRNNALEANFPGYFLWVGGSYPLDPSGSLVLDGEIKTVYVSRVDDVRIWFLDSRESIEKSRNWGLLDSYPSKIKKILIPTISDLHRSSTLALI